MKSHYLDPISDIPLILVESGLVYQKYHNFFR